MRGVTLVCSLDFLLTKNPFKEKSTDNTPDVKPLDLTQNKEGLLGDSGEEEDERLRKNEGGCNVCTGLYSEKETDRGVLERGREEPK